MITKYAHAAVIAHLWNHMHIKTSLNGCDPMRTSVSHHHFFHPSKALANQHKPLKHDMRRMLAMDDWCVCSAWRAWRAVEQRRIRWLKGTGGQQESSEADYTWRIKTERHAKWQKGCNDNQLLIEIEGLIVLGVSAVQQKQVHHMVVV